MTIHCPSDTRDLITDPNNYVKRGQISNFALYYRYFLDTSDNKFGLQAQKSEEALEFVQNFADPQKVFTEQNSILENLRNRQTDQLRYLSSSGEWLAPGHFYSAISRLDWRIVVGIGSEHVQETNMTLDHVYGIPYLPGSAFKGVLRSWVIQKHFRNNERLAMRDIEGGDSVDLKDKKKDFFAVFGSQKAAGKVRFLDALPAGNFRFELDIMNPHFSKYYTGSEFPTDDQQPNPISFLTLKEVPFRFLIHAKTAAPLDIAKNWFTEAIANLGFGAKSAVGYGYFRELNDKTEELKYEFAEKFNLEQTYDIYRNYPDRWGFVHINIEELVSYAPKIAILVTEEICEINSIQGVDDIPEILIETADDVVVLSEFGKWMWETTRDRLFERPLEFPNLIYSRPFRAKLQSPSLSMPDRELLQEKLMEISSDFRRSLNRSLAKADRESLQEKLLEVAADLESEPGKLFHSLSQDSRTTLSGKLLEIAGDLDARTPLLVDPIIPGGQGEITVDGFAIECSGIENGQLRLRNFSYNVGEV